MAYSIIYVIDLPGRQFNEMLPAESRLPNEEIERYAETGTEHEVRLHHTQPDFGAELSGCVTRLCLPYKYSWFLLKTKTTEAVAQWESRLRQIVSDVKIVRVDEYLMGRWEESVSKAASDGFWYRRPELATEFFRWIELQDRESWGLVRIENRKTRFTL